GRRRDRAVAAKTARRSLRRVQVLRTSPTASARLARKSVRIALTSGEPAGIGPELCAAIAQRELPCELICLGDRDLISGRAQQVGLPITLREYGRKRRDRGNLTVCHIPLAVASTAG